MYGCSNLSNVIVGEKLKEISIGAFSNTNIKKLNAPNLVFIGNQAFTACENLSSMQCENVTDIGRLAFANCHNLYSLNFPKLSSDDLQSYFMNCTSLSALHIDNDTYKSDQNGYGVEDQIIRNSYNDIIYVCPAIERMSSDVEDTMFTFINCKNLISAYLPNIKVLKHKMFSGCTSMTSANYPTVISVGDSIFSLCDQLKGVYLPNVTKFGNGMFNGCAMLQNADFS